MELQNKNSQCFGEEPAKLINCLLRCCDTESQQLPFLKEPEVRGGSDGHAQLSLWSPNFVSTQRSWRCHQFDRASFPRLPKKTAWSSQVDSKWRMLPECFLQSLLPTSTGVIPVEFSRHSSAGTKRCSTPSYTGWGRTQGSLGFTTVPLKYLQNIYTKHYNP